MPPELYLLGAVVGGVIALARSTQDERHKECLRNIKTLERENRCLDVHNQVELQRDSIFRELGG